MSRRQMKSVSILDSGSERELLAGPCVQYCNFREVERWTPGLINDEPSVDEVPASSIVR
jgi:hypothetical protein